VWKKKIVGLALLDEIQLIIISCALISLFCLPLILRSGESVQLLKQMQIIILGSVAAIIVYSITVALLFKKRGLGNLKHNLFLPGYPPKQKNYLNRYFHRRILYFWRCQFACVSIRI
jgi:hypothetical protein